MPAAPGGPVKGRGGPLVTREVEAWKQQLKAEHHTVKKQTDAGIKQIGDLYCPNAYMSFYKTQGSNTFKELEYTLDKIQECNEYDEKAPRDSYHPEHLRHTGGLQSSRPVTSSQIYGWYRPIDQPKYGFERSQLCKGSFMDLSHLNKSRSASSAAPPAGA